MYLSRTCTSMVVWMEVVNFWMASTMIAGLLSGGESFIVSTMLLLAGWFTSFPVFFFMGTDYCAIRTKREILTSKDSSLDGIEVRGTKLQPSNELEWDWE